MPFIPQTQQDTEQLLAAIGVASIHELFDEIPDTLWRVDSGALPEALTEQEIGRGSEQVRTAPLQMPVRRLDDVGAAR